MDDVRWSDNELRRFIEEESHVSWFADSSDREDARARFAHEVRARLVPAIQARLLERVGAVTDPEGITIVARDLVGELCCDDHARRWLMVCTEPWEYLTGWVVSRLVKSYRATVGKNAPSEKSLARILAD